MKILTAVCLLCFAANVFGQRLDIAALQSRCLPGCSAHHAQRHYPR